MDQPGRTGDVTIRELSSLEDVQAMAALLERIWSEPRILTPELLRALATHGNLVIGAFIGSQLVGAQMAFLGLEEGRPILHSHVTGVASEAQHRGIGFLLKLAQRDWALSRGIDVVTWTFDPMIARNAYFNIRKLGAFGSRFLRDFYGPMDDAFNAGERSDRLEARWELGQARVETALSGGGSEPSAAGAVAILDEQDGEPRMHTEREGDRLLVRMPSDYLALREKDLTAARAWRDAVADALEEAFRRGFRATGFVRDGGYLLERS
jgi:predicted GNAT superfamily acetyltransferase